MKRWGMVKHSLLGTGAKNFGGSHLGELGCFFFFWFAVCFVFTRKDRAWEEESKMSRVVHLGQGCRWPQSHRSFPKGLKMPWVFLPPDLAP